MTGTSFINRSLEGHWGGQSGWPLLLIAYSDRDKDFVKVLCLYLVSHYSRHLPAGDGRFLGRSGEGGELVLGLLWPRAGPFTGGFQALARLRLLWMAAGDFQDYWRAVCIWNTGGCSSFWRFCPYVYGDVRQCSAWRGLIGV